MPETAVWTRFGEPGPAAPWWIRRREIIAASPHQVWQALTRPESLIQWWCDGASVELQRGGAFACWGPHVYGNPAPPAEELTGPRGEIIDLEPESFLEHRWPLFGVETTVRWELENQLEMTRVTVTQTGPRAPGWDPGTGPNWWWVALPALRALLEKGATELRVTFDPPHTAGPVAFSAEFTTFPWVIWSKLTQPEELGKWWLPCTTLELRPGGRFHLEAGDQGPAAVVVAEECARFVHDWRWPGGEASRIEWSLEETDSAVRVRVEDHGPWPGDLPRAAVSVRWAAALLHLKQMSERGVSPRGCQD